MLWVAKVCCLEFMISWYAVEASGCKICNTFFEKVNKTSFVRLARPLISIHCSMLDEMPCCRSTLSRYISRPLPELGFPGLRK